MESGFLNPRDPKSVSAFEDKLAFEQANKAAIIAAIEELSRRRSHLKVVIRPHPAENMAYWKDLSDKHANVVISRQGAHVPWTLACKILLHTSCTTGFEAAVAGKAAISLVPRPSWITDSFISNQLNPVFANPIALIDAVESWLEQDEIPTQPRMSVNGAAHYVWNIDGKNSAQRISVLLSADLPSPRARVSLPTIEPYNRGDAQKRKYTASLPECIDVVNRFLGIIGKGQPFGVDQVSDSLFYLSPTAK